MYTLEAAGYQRIGHVVSLADQLQQSLIRRGFYDKGASKHSQAIKTAAWLAHSLQTLGSHGTWCPDSMINIQ